MKPAARQSLTTWFQKIPTIQYEGATSDNPLAYRYYNADEVILGKKMRDHLRMAVCYWHTFRGTALDIFGPGTLVRPWEDGTNSVDMAVKRTEVPRPIRAGFDAPNRDVRRERLARKFAGVMISPSNTLSSTPSYPYCTAASLTCSRVQPGQPRVLNPNFIRCAS